MDYLKRKKNLKIKQMKLIRIGKIQKPHIKKKKKRHDKYQDDKPIKKADGHLFYTTKKSLFEIKIRNLIYEDIYQHYEQNIFIVKIIGVVNSFIEVIFKNSLLFL